MCCPCRPLRGRARSHRYTSGFRSCDHPVGAGVPANRLGKEGLRPCRSPPSCVHGPGIPWSGRSRRASAPLLPRARACQG
ncbi:hypothetical protein EQ845_21300 [Pseudomonas putida]|nr:hypothetical protein EQ845_21300 [Pseudomonas putida]